MSRISLLILVLGATTLVAESKGPERFPAPPLITKLTLIKAAVCAGDPIAIAAYRRWDGCEKIAWPVFNQVSGLCY